MTVEKILREEKADIYYGMIRCQACILYYLLLPKALCGKRWERICEYI